MGKDKKNKSSASNLSYTQQIKWNKQEKAFWAKYFNNPPAPEFISPQAGVLSFRSCDISDSDIGFLTGRVKSIDALELDDAYITNESIQHLTRLEYLGELRLKGCTELDNDCVPALTQLKGIKLLHLGGTEITLEGLSGMHTLTDLEKLFVSADSTKDISAKMLELKESLPHCNIYINHTLYEFDGDRN